MATASPPVAAKEADENFLLKLQRAQQNNENTAKYFAAGMMGLVVVFMIGNWTRVAFKRYESKKKGRIGLLKVLVGVSRITKSLLFRKVPGFTSGGHALIYLGNFTTCASIAFLNIDWTVLTSLSKRVGWIAISNLALVTFLSLKNTPVAFLTTYSYKRLNFLHQVAGYSTVFWVILHAVLFIVDSAQSNDLHELVEQEQAFGIAAGFAFLIILGTALFLRRLRYEVFYIIHIVMFMFILVLVGLHHPSFAKKTIIITIFTASTWVADRALRIAKILLFSFGNSATVSPLPHGATHIVLCKSPVRTRPSTHCFLWIPGVRAAETHPFTVVSTDPLEFTVARQDGFTCDLHENALKNPGKALMASIDGPYGVVPDFTVFTRFYLLLAALVLVTRWEWR